MKIVLEIFSAIAIAFGIAFISRPIGMIALPFGIMIGFAAIQQIVREEIEKS